ncbi:MAG: family transcriptional regulator [Herbinix sp.]|nr:family transcriptional regulator [Herbinix sp.]
MINIPTINLVKTGMNITRLRDENGMSVKDLQDLFGFATPQAIYKWQHGTTLPSVDNLVVLAAVFAVQVDDILIIDVNHICK